MTGSSSSIGGMRRIPHSLLPELLTASRLELRCAIPQGGTGLSHTLTPVLPPLDFCVVLSVLLVSFIWVKV